ncbi:MAG: transporter [Eudoraea sp.]|uniref:transporter n=1 Tax=Eudoraea sp. TaxID=1979955 RepID=UPI003C74C20C
MKRSLQSIFFLSILCVSFTINSQELEPRALINLPQKFNFVGMAYAYASGNTILDPSLPLDDFNGRINSLVLAYIRSINFFGKSGKVDVILPFAGGDFSGNYLGSNFDDSYTGFGDLRARISLNLTGAPSLTKEEYPNYTQKIISGLGIQLIIPTGNYKKEQLPNLGSNRWSIKANYGLSYAINKWILEAHAGLWVFSDNKEFLEDNTLSQSALWIAKGNIIRSFQKDGMWLAFSFGYGYGADTFINGVRRDATISQLRLGLTYALPLKKGHSLKFTVASGIRFKQGGDFDVFGISYVYGWLDK